MFGKDIISEISFYEYCTLEKQHKLHFNTGKHVIESVLEYIHSDLWGPSFTITQGANKYFLFLIDDFSRKVFTILLKQKSDRFEKFRDWKILIENQTGKQIKSDNGLEFCNADFDHLRKINRILRYKIVPYTPNRMELQRG